MKPVTLFYQPRCPFCKKALGYLEELQRQEPYSRIEISGRAGVLCSVGSVFVSRAHRMDMGKKAVPAVCTAYENGSPFKTRGRMEI